MHPCPAPKCRTFDGNAALIDTPMCTHHTRKVAEALAELPKIYGDLHDAMGRGDASGNSERVRVSKTPPLPINVTARALQEDMIAVTRDAEVHYRARKRWSRNYRRGLEAQILTDRCKWLANHHEAILEVDAGYGVRILTIKHEARTMLGVTPLVHRLVGVPCPDCDHCALVRENGSSYVECKMCGRSFTWGDHDRPDDEQDSYARFVLIVAADLPPAPKVVHRSVHSTPDDRELGYGW